MKLVLQMLRSVVVLLVVADVAALPSAAAIQDKSVDDVHKSVVFLLTPVVLPVKDGKQQEGAADVGTGFLANLNGVQFLITAAHVAAKTNENSLVIVSGEADRAVKLPISSLTSSRAKPVWVLHPKADVAVIRVTANPDAAKVLGTRGLPAAMFRGVLDAPQRNRPLTTIGFPLGLGVLATGPDARVSAITKESRVSSGLITLRRADTGQPCEFYVLDSPSVGGFSGSPVMILPGAFSDGPGISFSNSILCVGLVHGTQSDDTGGKFAVVVPSAFIAQTLDSAYGQVVGNK